MKYRSKILIKDKQRKQVMPVNNKFAVVSRKGNNGKVIPTRKSVLPINIVDPKPEVVPVLDERQKFIQWCEGRYDLKNPETIQDKIQWLKLNDLSELKTRCADKILLHEYCKEKLGKDICIPILKVFDGKNIDFEGLPNNFVLKCNHGSGMNIIVKDKSKFDYTEAVNKLSSWLDSDFAVKNHYEWHYHDIVRKAYAEKYMFDSKQKESLYDYKFWCFNGEPKLYTINAGHGHGDILYFDMNGNVCNFYGIQYDLRDFVKPKSFTKMKEIAKILSGDFKFVRVDLYEIKGKIYLGELTFAPGSGMFRYKNKEDEIMVGDMLKL